MLLKRTWQGLLAKGSDGGLSSMRILRKGMDQGDDLRFAAACIEIIVLHDANQHHAPLSVVLTARTLQS